MRHESLTDEALIGLVQNKDQELYREVVLRYQDKLLRYAGYLLKNEADAADVVQDAFIKAFINLRSFDTKKKFSSWIYRIVHNEALNWIAKRKEIISLDKHEKWVANISDDSLPMEEVFDKKQIAQKVRSYIDLLPLAYRACLAFFYLEDKTYEEISAILKIPTGTVGTNINRGKKILRQIYEQKENNG